MKREPTAADVKAAWMRFNGTWNFKSGRELILPLAPPMSVFDVVVPPAEPEPVKAIRHCVIRVESGTMDGAKARRLVGTVPGTDIHVVLDVHFER